MGLQMGSRTEPKLCSHRTRTVLTSLQETKLNRTSDVIKNSSNTVRTDERPMAKLIQLDKRSDLMTT